VLIPKIQPPYKLVIVTGGNDPVGPFTITSENGVEIKAVVLISADYEYLEYEEIMPDTFIYKGKKYNLSYTFVPWE
jgi:hypothetical protein